MHFTVGLFFKEGQDLNELMEPFYLESEEHMVFQDIEEGLRDSYKNKTEKRKIFEGSYLFSWDSRLNHLSSEEISNLEDIEVKVSDSYDTFEIFAERMGYEKNKDGKYGYVSNPNGRYDWYQLGGRWRGMLLVKGETLSQVGDAGVFGDRFEDKPVPKGYRWTDIAKLKDIEWDLMEELSRKELDEEWERIAEFGKEIDYIIYGTDKEESKEDFINKRVKFGTYATLDSEGVWKDINEENKSFFSNYIKDLDEELFLAIIDCHI